MVKRRVFEFKGLAGLFGSSSSSSTTYNDSRYLNSSDQTPYVPYSDDTLPSLEPPVPPGVLDQRDLLGPSMIDMDVGSYTRYPNRQPYYSRYYNRHGRYRRSHHSGTTYKRNRRHRRKKRHRRRKYLRRRYRHMRRRYGSFFSDFYDSYLGGIGSSIASGFSGFPNRRYPPPPPPGFGMPPPPPPPGMRPPPPPPPGAYPPGGGLGPPHMGMQGMPPPGFEFDGPRMDFGGMRNGRYPGMPEGEYPPSDEQLEFRRRYHRRGRSRTRRNTPGNYYADANYPPGTWFEGQEGGPNRPRPGRKQDGDGDDGGSQQQSDFRPDGKVPQNGEGEDGDESEKNSEEEGEEEQGKKRSIFKIALATVGAVVVGLLIRRAMKKKKEKEEDEDSSSSEGDESHDSKLKYDEDGNPIYTSRRNPLVLKPPKSKLNIKVSQNEVLIVERFGKYSKKLTAGGHMLIPGVDRIAYRHTLKEKSIPVPKQQCFTRDQVQITTSALIFVKVEDPVALSYGVENPYNSLMMLSQACIRKELSKLTLDQVVGDKDDINARIVSTMNFATRPWGIRCTRFEVENVQLPAELQSSIDQRVEAEQKKVTEIIQSEGERTAMINRADAEMQAQVRKSQAEQVEKVNKAIGEAHVITETGEAVSNAIRDVASAINEPGGEQAVKMRIAEQYLNSYGQVASGQVSQEQASHIGNAFTNALGFLGSISGAGDQANPQLYIPTAEGQTSPPPALEASPANIVHNPEVGDIDQHVLGTPQQSVSAPPSGSNRRTETDPSVKSPQQMSTPPTPGNQVSPQRRRPSKGRPAQGATSAHPTGQRDSRHSPKEGQTTSYRYDESHETGSERRNLSRSSHGNVKSPPRSSSTGVRRNASRSRK